MLVFMMMALTFKTINSADCSGDGIGYTCPSNFACPSGTYNDETYNGSDATTCKVCPSGYECPTNEAAVECDGSTSKQFSFAGSTACATCPAGFECPSLYSTPINCDVGYYSLAGETECTQCPAGSYCADPTASPVSITATDEWAEAGSAYKNFAVPGQ